MDYKEFLISKLEKGEWLRDFTSLYTTSDIKFILYLQSGVRSKLEPIFVKEFKLSSSKLLSCNNMHLYIPEGHIEKFECVNEIIKLWAKERIRVYNFRKEHQLKKLKEDWNMINAKFIFISKVVSGEIQIIKVKKEEIIRKINSSGLQEYLKYLLNISAFDFTIEKIEELKQEKSRKEKEIRDFENISIYTLWSKELNELKSNL